MKKNYAFLFILPGLLGFAAFFILPFGIAVWYAFLDKAAGGKFVGLTNFINLFQNKSYLLGLKNTVSFIAAAAPLNILLSLSAALLLDSLRRKKAGGKAYQFFTLAFLIPLVIPSGSASFFWKILFGKNGQLNAWLAPDSIGWLTDYAQLVVIIIFIWKNIGYNMVLFLAGLAAIPKEYREAAEVDGASRFQVFKNITAVYLAPTFILTLIMSVINSFKVFKEVYLLMGAYPHESVYTLQHFMNNMFYSLDYQKLSAASIVFVIIIAGITQFLFKIERKAISDFQN